MYELDEVLKCYEGIVAVDGQSITTVTYLHIGGYKLLMGIGQVEALTAAKILTVQLKQATDAAGTGTKVLGSAGTFTAATGALSGIATCVARAEEMDAVNDFCYVGLTVSHDEGGNKVTAGIMIFGMGAVEPVA